MNQEKKRIGFFEKYLTLWVAVCIAAGIGIGHWEGDSIGFLSSMEVFKVNIPVAVLIWLMIYPMMLQVDFSSLKNIGKRPKGVILTLVVN
ncbi:MAG: arsenic resistance protein [Draconibacterium sp.]